MPGPVPTSDPLASTRRYYRLVDEGDLDGVVDWFAPDGVYHRPGYEPLRGRDALRAFYGGARVIDTGAHTLSDVLVDGDRVAVRGRFDGRLKDGSEVSVGFADFVRYDGDGRAVERHSYFDTPTV